MNLSNLGNAVATGFSYFTIIYLTGLGGLFSERSGIVNIGLEGMMIIGTVTGAYGTVAWGPAQGLAFGAACGALFALIHAVATITFRVDQIVSGVVINLSAIGIARFLSEVFFGQATQSDPGAPHFHTINIPLLSKLPWGLGAAFSNMSPVVVFAFLMVFPVSFVLYRTRFGLRLRSAGENPEATSTLGVRVAPLRYAAVMISGAMAGLAGAFLAFEVNDHWHEGQTVGLGFIALAALILSNWNPKRLMAAAMLFGFAEAVPLWLNHAPIIRLLPPAFIQMTPYVVTIVAVAGFVGRVTPPAAAGRAYEGGAL
jgi:general nucleoside transport system permease protein